jgi:hypothetical protein
MPLNVQVDTRSDEITDVKICEAECTHKQQYTVRSSFPIKKRKYAYEAK